MQTRIIQACLVAMVAGAIARAQSPAPAPYWRGVDWRTATPESQGLDSQALASAIEQLRQQKGGRDAATRDAEGKSRGSALLLSLRC
jgi:hypothetical protein